MVVILSVDVDKHGFVISFKMDSFIGGQLAGKPFALRRIRATPAPANMLVCSDTVGAALFLSSRRSHVTDGPKDDVHFLPVSPPQLALLPLFYMLLNVHI